MTALNGQQNAADAYAMSEQAEAAVRCRGWERRIT